MKAWHVVAFVGLVLFLDGWGRDRVASLEAALDDVSGLPTSEQYNAQVERLHRMTGQ